MEVLIIYKEGDSIKIIKKEDKDYPETLRKIKDSPEQLYTEGNIALLKTNIISIIGSRACSEKGIELTKKFSRELVYQGLTIASGMAIRNRYNCT